MSKIRDRFRGPNGADLLHSASDEIADLMDKIKAYNDDSTMIQGDGLYAGNVISDPQVSGEMILAWRSLMKKLND